MNLELKQIVEDAARAPSGHNTQPWKFEVQENRITIRPNFKRRLKVVDPDDHALYISIGCALENLILSAKAHKFFPKVSSNFSMGEDEIVVYLIPSQKVEKDELYDYIRQRQCTRSAYDDLPVESSVLEGLSQEVKNESVDILYFTGREEIRELEPFIIEASNLQFRNKDFVNELVSWIRFNKKEALQKGDGVWSSCMGLPNIPKSLGNLIMKKFVSSKSEAERWKKLIYQSAGFALFVVKRNTKEDWVKLGRSFQRFGLKATQLNLKHAHVNMPCEELAVRKKLSGALGIEAGKEPLLLVRFGYGEAMPYSFRLAMDEILVSKEKAATLLRRPSPALSKSVS